MHYLLTCQCGNQLTISRTQAGQSVQCDACGQPLVVPNLRNLAQLPPAGPLPNETRKSSRGEDAQTVWRSWRGPVVALATAVFFFAGLAGSWSLYQWNLSRVDYTVQDEIEAGDKLFDAMSADELSLAWSEYQKLQLTFKDRPMFYRMAKYSEQQWTNTLIRGGAALVGLVTAVMIWLTAPKRPKEPTAKPM